MKKVIVILIFLVSCIAFGQRKNAANQFFKEYAYVKSAELYEKIYQKGDSSQLVLSRLADSYYFNTKTKPAEYWYAKLLKLYGKEVSSEYYFRYSQVLKSNGKKEESDQLLLKFNVLERGDSRGERLVADKDYFSNLIQKKKYYADIYNVSINTKYSDFGTFMAGGKLLFSSTRPGIFSKKKLYKWNKQPFLDLYTVRDTIVSVSGKEQVDLTGEFRLSGPVNTRYHEATAVVTKDGKTMYFTRDNYDGEKLGEDKTNTTHLKLYKANFVNGLWKEIEELPFNNDDYSVGHPALSSDEKTLYIVSDMPGGYGYTDIYKIPILEGGSYGVPVNLGKTINTEGREMFPFIAENNKLYFSSDGHLGMGALDIFESERDGNNFRSIKNLGTPINSLLDDFSFMLLSKGERGYFSSNRKGGKGDDDIYSFTVNQCKELLAGVVTDSKTQLVLPGALVRLLDVEGLTLEKAVTDKNGFYRFLEIDCEESYIVTADKLDYRSAQKELTSLAINGKEIRVNLALTPLIQEDQIVINPIFFDFDKYYIRADAEYELEHIISVMNNNPAMVIKIESHTDSRGTKKYNEQLSDNRAKSTRDYLISRGIESNRIESAIGYGEYQLLNHCDDAHQNSCSKEEHQLNRRSYFYIVGGVKNVKSRNE